MDSHYLSFSYSLIFIQQTHLALTGFNPFIMFYRRLRIIRTFKGNRKKFELSGDRLSRVKVYRCYIENALKGNENCVQLAGGSSYRGFELPGVDCTIIYMV